MVVDGVVTVDVGLGLWDMIGGVDGCSWWIDFWAGWIIDCRYGLMTIRCCRLLLRVKKVIWGSVLIV